jgi:hypothetical protein
VGCEPLNGGVTVLTLRHHHNRSNGIITRLASSQLYVLDAPLDILAALATGTQPL